MAGDAIKARRPRVGYSAREREHHKERALPWDTVVKLAGEPLKFRPYRNWVNRDRSSN